MQYCHAAYKHAPGSHRAEVVDMLTPLALLQTTLCLKTSGRPDSECSAIYVCQSTLQHRALAVIGMMGDQGIITDVHLMRCCFVAGHIINSALDIDDIFCVHCFGLHKILRWGVIQGNSNINLLSSAILERLRLANDLCTQGKNFWSMSRSASTKGLLDYSEVWNIAGKCARHFALRESRTTTTLLVAYECCFYSQSQIDKLCMLEMHLLTCASLLCFEATHLDS